MYIEYLYTPGLGKENTEKRKNVGNQHLYGKQKRLQRANCCSRFVVFLRIVSDDDCLGIYLMVNTLGLLRQGK